MKQGADDFIVEPTPVIDIRKHGLPLDSGVANDASDNWENEKTEVYMDSDEEEATASLIDAEGENHPITAFPFVLGRGGECDLVLVGKGLSRKHVEIVFQSGRFVVNDLDSLNGLKVNGYKVSRVILEEGDQIKLGEVNLQFSNSQSSGGIEQGVSDPDAKIAGQSDPFSDGGNKKKLLLTVSGVLVLGVLLFGGYAAYDGTQSNAADRIVSNQSNSSSNQNTGSTTTSSPKVSPKADTATPPASITAPPPSLALVKKPAIKQVAAVPISKPIKPKAVVTAVSKNLSKAKKLLLSANERYLDGDAPSLFDEFKRYEGDSRLPKKLRSNLRAKHEALAKLYATYLKGQKAFVAGDSGGAFASWTKFLEKEQRVFKSKRSIYADQVVPKVVDEYVLRGNALSLAKDHHKAYRMWGTAVKYGDSVAAKIALDSANTRSKQLYRKALRLENVNASKAKQLWEEGINLVPPGTEYYTKASSKLAWYQKWGG